MAMSAFKSSSKRGNLGTTSSSTNPRRTSEDLSKKIPHRRSRSVSAVSRNSSITTIDEFLNKRDNPLFHNPPQNSPQTDQNASKLEETHSTAARVDGLEGRRGRSVSRSSVVLSGEKVVGARKEVGRSLSRVDTGRRQRSVSRGHCDNSESENEQKYCVSSNFGSRSNWSSKPEMQIKSVATISDTKQTRQTWSSQHPVSEPSDDFVSTNWEDGISTTYLSEAEEKTIRAVTKQMKAIFYNGNATYIFYLYLVKYPQCIKNNHPAGDTGSADICETVRSEVRRAISEIQNDIQNAIQRNNPTVIATTNVDDIPPELVNPDAVELVSEIRRQYSSKLNQSEERAKKLREDLAVEEHRGQELGRILKEILPEPKSSQAKTFRPRRKNSVERWKMSKRLTEEAMNYFDECVSISTFDSSDFSSTEDPPFNLGAFDSLVSDGGAFPSASSSASAHNVASRNQDKNKESDNQVHVNVHPHNNFGLSTSNYCMNTFGDFDDSVHTKTPESRSSHFSFIDKPVETSVGAHGDIRSYIKMFEKETRKASVECKAVRSSYYDGEDYELQHQDETLLFDRVIYKNRIETGGLLLCSLMASF
ncbi:hypothetical protein GIB67_043153 [Kingdonia uniflora]|uniref:Uncharacterized protein n=1 Tax=Kingdonia uniflora TaxID=39325 RepID=A0A7J7NK04_9MAGN|nr:hypothetical protein GIB67_043153 [Kingdonia uniflora]